jgi:hypothetical protein
MSLNAISDFCLQDVGSKASEFGYLSGVYSMELIVGDAVLSNSFSWKVADVTLRFSDTVPAPGPTKDQYLYAPKPEIKVCIFKLSNNFYCKRNWGIWYISTVKPHYIVFEGDEKQKR